MNLRGDRTRRVTPTIDLTPMIDVVLQLLVFFMLSSTFVVQSSIQIEMPQAEGATQLEQKDLSITLAYGNDGPDGKGRIYVDNVEVASMNELTHILTQKVTERPDIMLLVRSDTRTPTGRLVEVMGIANSVGITRYGIGAEPPGDEQ
jgi:biopolymer transport protein ExbD